MLMGDPFEWKNLNVLKDISDIQFFYQIGGNEVQVNNGNLFYGREEIPALLHKLKKKERKKEHWFW